jgi:hypothetical protein
MDEGFELPVLYKGRELLFPARLVVLGYIYKIEVNVNGQVVFFEKDEERNWRVLVEPSDSAPPHKMDIELLKAIGDAIEQATS